MAKTLACVLLSLCLAAAVVFIACGRETPSGREMRVARYYWPGMYWVEIAEQKGWFRQAGLNVTLIDTNPDYYASLEATAAGALDTNAFYLFDLMRFVARGVDLVMVVNTDLSNGTEGLVARPEIESVRQLRGRKIGLPLGTNLEYELGEVLARHGLTVGATTLVDLPAEKAVAALAKRKVDAILTWEPFVTEAVAEGGRKLFDTSDIHGLSTVGYVFSRKFIRERPADVRAFLKVWHRTTRFIKEHPEEAFAIIANIYGKPLHEVRDFAQIDLILDLDDNRTRFSHSHGFESLAGTSDRINRHMLKRGVIDRALDHDRFLDYSFLVEL